MSRTEAKPIDAALTIAELASPERAVITAIELYGQDAATAVAWCALDANLAGRTADYRFWCQVFRSLTDRSTKQ
ncbi:hypothetical protein [Mesorhizobium sp. B2-2-2]|uniref:hypothetical protein n=1 Tax=Mesorhizobium sp. B2-2-2 TaxID=2589964 RepID=UPI001FEFFC78|nr:hypothetical protein [Mesorhizobium sp. B2-2-2]